MRTLTGMDQPDVDGCSVTGGYVYRGEKIKGLKGTYFFGDYCSGNIWTFKVKNGKAVEFQNRTEEINIADGEFTNYISSFGEDEDGELYIIDYNGGVYKIVGENIEKGNFKPNKNIKHTHIGSVGNLALEEIQAKMENALKG